MVGMEEIDLMLLHRIPLRVFGILMGFPPFACTVAHLAQIVLPFLVQRNILFLVPERFDLSLGRLVSP
jgi:hypothetical protein